MNASLEAKNAFRALIEEAIRSGQIGTNLTQRDLNIALNDQDVFRRATTALDALPTVRKHYGTDAIASLTLKFALKLCSSVMDRGLDEAAFETSWQEFDAEVNEPSWNYIGVAHVQNIETDFKPFSLGDDVSIGFWEANKVQSLMGWTDPEEELFRQEWRVIMPSLYVMVIKDQVVKSPNNAYQIAWDGLWKKANLALRALRLLKPGDVRLGRIWVAQPASFSILWSRVQSVGISMLRPGASYNLSTGDEIRTAETYRLLSDFDASQGALPKKKREILSNIEVALRSFDAIYDRQFHRADDQIVDAVTVIEALFRIGDSGLSYRTALRAAGLLANSDDERIKLFDDMRLYYGTRSAIVHGLVREKKHEKVIQDNKPLLKVVRQLLLGFLKLAKPGAQKLDETLWKDLDKIVLHSQRREELRRRMGLTELDDSIRERAYQLYQQRAETSGSAEEDWLKAETEILTAREEHNKPLSQRFFEMAAKSDPAFWNTEPASQESKPET